MVSTTHYQRFDIVDEAPWHYNIRCIQKVLVPLGNNIWHSLIYLMLLLRFQMRCCNVISNVSLKILFHNLHIWINVNRSWSKVFALRVWSYWVSYACLYDHWLHICPSFEKTLCLISKSKRFHFLFFESDTIALIICA